MIQEMIKLQAGKRGRGIRALTVETHAYLVSWGRWVILFQTVNILSGFSRIRLYFTRKNAPVSKI